MCFAAADLALNWLTRLKHLSVDTSC